MADENFTQEQVDQAIQDAKQEWVENELNPLVAERDDLLQYKPHEPTDEEKAMQEKQQNLWNKEVALTLKENGLEQFADIVNVNDEEQLNEIVKSLTNIKNDMKLQAGYVPEDKRKDDEYSKFEKDGNTQGMIASKLAGLFK